MTVTHLVSDTATVLPIHHARGLHSACCADGGVWVLAKALSDSGSGSAVSLHVT